MVKEIDCCGRGWREVANEWNIDPSKYRPILFSDDPRHIPLKGKAYFLQQLKRYPNCDNGAFLFTKAQDNHGSRVESLVVPDPQTPQLQSNSAEVNGEIGKTYVVAKVPKGALYLMGRVYPFVFNGISCDNDLLEITRNSVRQITRIMPQHIELEIDVVTREQLIDCCLRLMGEGISLSRKLLGELRLEDSSSRVYTKKAS